MDRFKLTARTDGGNLLAEEAPKPPTRSYFHPRPPAACSKPQDASPAAFAQAARQRIGERVRAARIAAHLTQEELAGQEYSKSYISAVERGKMTPSFHALGLLAERLVVTRSYLLGEDLPPSSASPPDAPVVVDQQATEREKLDQLVGQERYDEALTLCAECGRADWMSEVRAAYAQVLAAQGRYADAYQQMMQAYQKQTPGH